jgi:Domain of unknown function (DUF4351)
MWTVFERRGFVKGKREGEREGEIQFLQKVLQRKFGPLNESVRESLAAMSIEQIDQVVDQIWDAKSLDEVGLSNER